MQFKPLALLLACLLALPASALDVITLHWRDASEVADALRGQLQAGEKVSALDNQLILEASPARSAQLRQLVAQLDRRTASLLVEVSQAGRQSQSGVQLGGSISRGISIDSRQGITARPGASVTLSGNERNTSSQTTQTLRLLDGTTGLIETGSSRPLPWLMLRPDGRPLLGVRYQEAITGFYIQPRVSGSRVYIRLAARQEDFNGRQQDSNWLETQVEGALGEWISIGGIGRDDMNRETVLIGHSRSNNKVEREVRLRISQTN